jgi:hypothetical protein
MRAHSMHTISLRVAGSAPPAQAWERYALPQRWPEWAPQIVRVETTGTRIVAGLTGRVYGPLGVFVHFVVDEVDEVARRWSWTVTRGPLTVRLVHSVDPGRDDGCITGLTFSAPPLVAYAYAPLARFALRRLVTT